MEKASAHDSLRSPTVYLHYSKSNDFELDNRSSCYLVSFLHIQGHSILCFSLLLEKMNAIDL